MPMDILRVVLLLASLRALSGVEPFTEFVAEWDEYRTYFVKNLDFTNYRIATYSKQSGDLIVFYLGDIIEDNDNQIRIDAHGSAVWGPRASDWRADSALLIKPMKTIHFRDDLSVAPKAGRIVADLSRSNDPVMLSVRYGAPLAKIPSE